MRRFRFGLTVVMEVEKPPLTRPEEMKDRRVMPTDPGIKVLMTGGGPDGTQYEFGTGLERAWLHFEARREMLKKKREAAEEALRAARAAAKMFTAVRTVPIADRPLLATDPPRRSQDESAQQQVTVRSNRVSRLRARLERHGRRRTNFMKDVHYRVITSMMEKADVIICPLLWTADMLSKRGPLAGCTKKLGKMLSHNLLCRRFWDKMEITRRKVSLSVLCVWLYAHSLCAQGRPPARRARDERDLHRVRQLAVETGRQVHPFLQPGARRVRLHAAARRVRRVFQRRRLLQGLRAGGGLRVRLPHCRLHRTQLTPHHPCIQPARGAGPPGGRQAGWLSEPHHLIVGKAAMSM